MHPWGLSPIGLGIIQIRQNRSYLEEEPRMIHKV